MVKQSEMNSSVAYYDHNAEKYAERSWGKLDQAALEEFVSHLPRGARVLDAGCGAGRDLHYFSGKGLQAEGLDSSERLIQIARTRVPHATVKTGDLLFMNAVRESYDGIWANRSLLHLPPAGCQRVVASFFGMMKRGGILFICMEEGSGETQDRRDDPNGPARTFYRYPKDEVASLIRQNGFRLILEGKSSEYPERMGFLAKRI